MTPLEIEYAIDRLDNHIRRYGENMPAYAYNAMRKTRKRLLLALVKAHEQVADHAEEDIERNA